MSNNASWRKRQFGGFGEAGEYNRHMRKQFEAGRRRFSLAFDLPTQTGVDPAEPSLEGESGFAGVSIRSVNDMKALFEGIPMGEVSVSMTINATAPFIVGMWIAAAEDSGVHRSGLKGTIQNEIPKEYLARHAVIDGVSIDRQMKLSVELCHHIIRSMPHVYPVSISGGHVREAGGSAAMEIACGLADALEYCRRLVGMGHTARSVLERLSFIFGTDTDFVSEAAKLVAVREMYEEVMSLEFDLSAGDIPSMRMHSNTFGSALTFDEPLNNIVRAAVQAIGAIVGGAKSIHVCSFDEAHCIPSPLGARIADRTQDILRFETDIDMLSEIVGTSPRFRAMVNGHKRDAKDVFERIEASGGIVRAIEDGWVKGSLESDSVRRFEESAPRVGQGNGVSQLEWGLINVRTPEPNPVARTRASRMDIPSGEPMESIIGCVRSGATIAELCRVFREGAFV